MEKQIIPFELTNEQRKCLGLVPVEDMWELVYFSDMYLYYEGEIIRKKITIDNDGSYYEAELCERTSENRTILLPKTKRGKPKKMNYTATQSFSPFGVYFDFTPTSVRIANYTTQTTFFEDDELNNTTLQEWVGKWIEETTEKDLQEIELYKQTKRQHTKYSEGDFFTFKVGRRHWGFGRIVLNIAEIRKSGALKAHKNYGLDNLMGQPLYIHIYYKIADTPNIDLADLAQCMTLPVQAIMDNHFYYGEYNIIGNKPVEPEEWEPIISYGKSINWSDRNTVYLQYGLIFKETTIDKFNKYLMSDDGKDNPYRNEGVGFSIDHFSTLKDLKQGKKIESTLHLLKQDDLRAKENSKIKHEIFKFFGLNADKSYAENLKLQMGMPSSLGDKLKQLLRF